MDIELNTIKQTLSKTDFSINENFLESFYDPVPRGLSKLFFISLILLTVFNVLAILVILYIFVYKPNNAKKAFPKNSNHSDLTLASAWFDFAEKNLKYNHFNEIIKGYRHAITLDPENTFYKLKYYIYLAGYEVKNKIPATGKPFGFTVNKIPEDYYPAFRSLVDHIRKDESRKEYEKYKNQHLFAIISWLAFDKKLFNDCLLFGLYSIEIEEFKEDKKDSQQKIELLYLLAGASASIGERNKAVSFVIQGLTLAQQLHHKTQIAMGFEFLGECFYKAESYPMAETLFLEAHHYEKRRWLAIYRLYLIYKKVKNKKQMEIYKRKYILQQKELGPI